MKPILQIALDFAESERALRLAREAVAGGADWLEAGTPLIKSAGLDAVRALRAAFPSHTIVADMKIMDAGRAEVELAAKAGANVVAVLGVAADGTIRECIQAGHNFGVKIAVDLLRVADPADRARQVEEWGADLVTYHIGVDEQMQAATPLAGLRAVAEAVRLPVAAAGGINSETAAAALEAGAAIVIVGGAIIKATNAAEAARHIKQVMLTGKSVATEHFRRVGEDELAKVLRQVSTSNLSDAAHRQPCIIGLRPLRPGMRVAGPALTVRAAPGDWAKPVEAIDQAPPGSVIVIAAAGAPPAVWGELATHSARVRGVAGVVIDGAIRDTADVARLEFPAFVRLICAHAGEPKGWGEIGAPVRIEGQTIASGDWIVGDDDGLIALPRRGAVEIANRALDCLEAENRIRAEIEAGKKTLGTVKELLKWEKK